MKALIIIDMQNDFMPGGSLAVPGGDEIIPMINDLQRHFDLVVATQDWHPQDHKSFASNHNAMKPFDVIELAGLAQVLWPNHCVQETLGAAFHKDLAMNRVAAIFRKGMDRDVDSYSGFFDNGHFQSTGLTGYLREKKVEEIFLCGLAGDYCVFYSAMDAISAGFQTSFIADATRFIDPAAVEKVTADIKKAGGKVISNTEVLASAF